MVIGYLIAFVVFLLDLISKLIVMNNMNLGQSFFWIPNFIKFHYVENTGMAFSLLSDSTPILFIISLVASLGLGYIVYRYSDFFKRKVFSISLAFMLGGTVGNLVDRFLTMIGKRNGVVDFIEIWIGNVNIIGGTSFNIADSFLVIGCILLIIELLILEPIRVSKKEKRLKELEDGTKDNC